MLFRLLFEVGAFFGNKIPKNFYKIFPNSIPKKIFGMEFGIWKNLLKIWCKSLPKFHNDKCEYLDYICDVKNIL